MRRLAIVLKSSWSAPDMKNSTNGKEPTKTSRKWKLDLGAKKLGGSDIDQSNSYENQPTHFVGYTKNPNL